MDPLRRRIIADFEKGAGRHDDPKVYGGPSDDPGLIGPGSVSLGGQRRSGVGLAGRPSGDRSGDPASLRHRRRAGSVELPPGPVPAGSCHAGLRADHDLWQYRGGHRHHRTRQARAFVRQRHTPRRSAVSRARSRTARVGAHLHSVDDHAGLRTHEKTSVPKMNGTATWPSKPSSAG